MRSILLILIILLASFTTMAQTTITGFVTDDDGSPLVGAVVKNTTANNGVAVDLDGKFSIKANKGDILEFSFLGYATRTQKINNEKNLSIILKEDTKYLDEVVVIGYGEFRREDLTGSVGTANIDDASKAPVPNLVQALAGRVAGLQITSGDAQPGTDMQVVIRGANSLTQENNPLYVVDGFVMENFDISTLNPSDIESINILKDASSTAIYGSRGANGIIIVETKTGKKGKPVITYEGSVGFQNVSKTMDLMGPYDFVRYQIDRDPVNMTDLYLTQPGLTLDDYKKMGDIDWQDKLFRSGILTTHSVSLNGGLDRTSYSASLSYVKQDGVIINTGYDKYQGRLRLDQTISDKLKARVSVNYSKDKSFGQFSSQQQQSANAYTTYLMYRTWGYRPVRVGVDNIFEDLYDGDDDIVAIMNPILSSKNEFRERTRTTLNMNGMVEYSFLKNLRLRVNFGLSERSIMDEEFNNSKTYKGYPSANNLKGVNGSYQDDRRTNWSNENVLTYKLASNRDHKLDLVGGLSFEENRSKLYGFSVYDVPVEGMGITGMDMGTPSSTSSRILVNGMISYFGRVDYKYKSKYSLTASFRADGSSKFTKKNRWGYFPSGALAWDMNKEDFMKNISCISESKLRISYGVMGNNRIPEDARFPSLTVDDYYSFGNETPQYAVGILRIGNPDLKWEKTEEIDLGYNFSLFNSRVNFVFDLYRKTTKDLLLNANMPYTTGTASMYRNVGKVRNQGLEISINTLNVETRDFSWSSDFNISFNQSKVLELTEDQESILTNVTWTGDWNATPLYIAKKGQPMSAFYGYVWAGNYQYSDFDAHPDGSYTLKKGIPTNGNTRESIQPGDIKYVDQNGDGVVNEHDRVIIGNPNPIHTGGFNNNLRYKDFSLNIFLQWNYGGDVFNANRLMFEGNATNRNINQFESYNNRWTPDNQNNKYHRIGGSGPRGVYSSRTVEDASFLRLKTVRLSYNIPKMFLQKTGITSAQVYFAGQDLLTITGYSGMDPEVSTKHTALTPGFDYSAYPRNRTFTAGVKLTF